MEIIPAPQNNPTHVVMIAILDSSLFKILQCHYIQSIYNRIKYTWRCNKAENVAQVKGGSSLQ